jgi:hypothetical protein
MADFAVSTSTAPLQTFIPRTLSINLSNPAGPLTLRTPRMCAYGREGTHTLLPSSGKGAVLTYRENELCFDRIKR